jgi:hypothetical protein
MSNWQNRERKQKAKQARMPKHGMGLFTVIRIQVERSKAIKAKK